MKGYKTVKFIKYFGFVASVLLMLLALVLFYGLNNTQEIVSVSMPVYKAENNGAEVTAVSDEYVAPKIVLGYETHFLDQKYGTHCLVYACEEENNLITDYSFEKGNGNWNQSSLLGSGVVSVVSGDKAHSGNKCLKFKANNLASNAWCTFYLDVEPNTVYHFTALVRGEMWSDTNKCDMRFGLVDASTGKFIANSYKASHSADSQLGICFDDNWHIERVEVNTGSATKIGIGFRGKNSVAYIDDLYFCKASDAVEYKFNKRDVESATVTDENPENLGCNTDYNLVENFNFEDAESSYWQDALGHNITASVVNTDSSAGKALHYSENTYGTGVPKQTYYIKWVDVEPNTEYTFSASYKVTKSGNGWFGVINGSEYLPAAIKKFYLGDLQSAGVWNNVGVSFNTGGFSRIGIAVCDVGGEAYIDNIRLYKSVYGIYLEEDENVQSFRFEYDYTDTLNNPANPLDDSRTFSMGNAYMYYKSSVSTVSIENEGDNSYLKATRIKDNPTFPLRTTIQLEPDSYYRISFRYKLKTTNNGVSGNWAKKPTFTACLGKDVWYNWIVKQNESRPCQLSGNTLSNDGYAYTDNVGLVGMHLAATDEWATYSEIIYTSSIVGGADKNQKYLGIHFSAGSTFEYICLDDFVAEKVVGKELSSDEVTFDYCEGEDAGIYRSLLSMNEIDTENGYLHISDGGHYYDFNAFNFGYILKPDSDYKIELRYKVNKCKITSSHIFGLYEKSNFFGSSATLFSEDELIYAFDRNVTSDYTETSFIFSTSSNDGINKFLTFAGETYLGLDMYIDWIKITRLPKPGELVQLVDFEDEQNPTFVDGTTDYSFEKDDMGNRYIRIYSDDSTDEYPHFVFRTDAELKPNTDYTVSFQYKSSENWFDRAFFLAGSGINNWQFRYKPHWTQDSTVVNRTNLIGNELTDSAGYPYRTGKLAINKSTQWKKAEVTFNSGNIVDGAFKYLSFLVQFGPTGTKVREVAIDDIMLIEHNKNLQSGYVLCNMGYGAEPYYLNGSKVSALLESDGYLFNGWFNNKAKTEKFVSDDETALPYMIYADYDIDLNCDGLSNLVDLIRLKKSASGEITDYVVATDVNSDGSVNALDIANFKYYLLY